MENPESKNIALIKIMPWASIKLSSGNQLPLTFRGLQELQSLTYKLLTLTYPYMKVAMLESHIGDCPLAAHLSE